MIRVFVDNQELVIEAMTFSGGERHLKIKGFKNPSEHYSSFYERQFNEVCVIAHVDSSESLIDTLLIKDALQRVSKGALRDCYTSLYLPYIPYARQDRVMESGEPLSAAFFGKLINMANYDRVVVSDPHSDVSPSHIDKVEIIEQHELAIGVLGKDFFNSSLVLVAPDAGAMKKTLKLAKEVGLTEVGVGAKIRDTSTGQITGTNYSGPDLEGKSVLMVDDICDGGATFTHLAGVLKEKGAEEVFLYVTHGIFSKGIDAVFDGLVDQIYCAYAWEKNIVGKNEKGILIKVDTSKYFK